MKIPISTLLENFCGIKPGDFGIRVPGAGTVGELKVEPREFLRTMSRAPGLPQEVKSGIAYLAQLTPISDQPYPEIMSVEKNPRSSVFRVKLNSDKEDFDPTYNVDRERRTIGKGISNNNIFNFHIDDVWTEATANQFLAEVENRAVQTP